MASYKYERYIARSSSEEFDRDHQAGHVAPFSGIYLCIGCGRETAINHDEPLPSRNHHDHAPGRGAILWRLIVYASHQPD